MSDSDDLTVDDALALLADDEDIHTFVQPAPGMVLGADWPRADLESLIRDTERRVRTGDTATSMGHGMALWRASGWLFVATRAADREADAL